jgi:hypothetical protein
MPKVRDRLPVAVRVVYFKETLELRPVLLLQ